MEQSHLKDVAALERVCFSVPWTADMLADELHNDGAFYAVAEGADGLLLGYAGLRVVLDEGYITNIAVAPGYRRRGVAGALVEMLCRFGRGGLAFLTLEVRASNRAAAALYEKHGFTPAGRRKNYYDNPREDAIIMTLRF